MKFKFLLLLPLFCWSPTTLGNVCGSTKGTEETKKCLEQELRQSDKDINDRYQGLRKTLDKAAQLQLRDAQRLWLKERSEVCSLDDTESDREKWLQSILGNEVKVLCVARYTRTRIQELESGLSAATAKSPPPRKPKREFREGDELQFTDFNIIAQRRVTEGKWYFEVTAVTETIVAAGYNTLIMGFGCKIDDKNNPSGERLDLEKMQVELYGGVQTYDPERWIGIFGPGKTTFRFAIDLQNGVYFVGENARWNEKPGTSDGHPIKYRRSCYALVQSTIPIEKLGDGLTLNIGDQPFAFDVPDGFKAVVKAPR